MTLGDVGVIPSERFIYCNASLCGAEVSFQALHYRQVEVIHLQTVAQRKPQIYSHYIRKKIHQWPNDEEYDRTSRHKGSSRSETQSTVWKSSK